MKQILALLFTSLMGTLNIAAESAIKVDAGAAKKIMSVDEITVRTLEIHPAQVTIEATGTVNSGGWSKPALVPVKSNVAGVLVFDFVAVPPGGMATQALVSVKASITVEKPADFKEVKVVSQTNTKSAK